MVINHTRASRFGIDKVDRYGRKVEFNFFEYIVNFFKELDSGGVKAHDDFLSAAHYLGNRYQEDILGRTIKDPWTQFEMNPVEHLTYSTMEFEYMQLYTTYDMENIYHLSWPEWWDQSFGTIEFQLKIGRQLYSLKKATVDDHKDGIDEKKMEEELMRQTVANGFQGQFKR